MAKFIDLNADMGESWGRWTLGADEEDAYEEDAGNEVGWRWEVDVLWSDSRLPRSSRPACDTDGAKCKTGVRTPRIGRFDSYCA